MENERGLTILKFTLTINDTEEITFKINPSYKELETSLVYAISDDDNITHIKIESADYNKTNYYMDSYVGGTVDELIDSLSEIEHLNIDFMDYIKFQEKAFLNDRDFLLFDEIVYYFSIDDYIDLAIENSSLFEIYNTQPIFNTLDYKKFYNIDAIKGELKQADNVYVTKTNGILIFE